MTLGSNAVKETSGQPNCSSGGTGTTQRSTAILAFAGMVLAAFVGGICALLAAVLPIVVDSLAEEVRHINPRPLRAADFRVGHLSPSVFYGVPTDLSDSAPFSAHRVYWSDPCSVSDCYNVLYESADLTELAADVDVSWIPASTLSEDKRAPTVPVLAELWNTHEDSVVIIDGITMEVASYDPPVQSAINVYYVVPWVPGGPGPLLPIRRYSVLFTPRTTAVRLLQNPTIRIPMGPNEGVLLIIDITFESPGKYDVAMSVQYHLIDGSSDELRFDEFSYGWICTEFLDGSLVTVID